MVFVGQVAVPDTELTRTLFTWGESAHLFVDPHGDSYVFKVVDQDLDAQTAEEHYASDRDFGQASRALDPARTSPIIPIGYARRFE